MLKTNRESRISIFSRLFLFGRVCKRKFTKLNLHKTPNPTTKTLANSANDQNSATSIIVPLSLALSRVIKQRSAIALSVNVKIQKFNCFRTFFPLLCFYDWARTWRCLFKLIYLSNKLFLFNSELVASNIKFSMFNDDVIWVEFDVNCGTIMISQCRVTFCVPLFLMDLKRQKKIDSVLPRMC